MVDSAFPQSNQQQPQQQVPQQQQPVAPQTQVQPQPEQKKHKENQAETRRRLFPFLPTPKKPAESSQDFLDISEIRDGTVMLKNGSLKAVLMVSSMNFALKSTEEQESTIRSFQRLLNSLEEPIQILVQSRKLDIDLYLQKLKDIERQQVNELLRIQTGEYRNFIKELVGLAHIMTKRFYVVVSFTSGRAVNEGLAQKAKSIFSPAQTVTTTRKSFDEDRKKLYARVDHVGSVLSESGLRSIVLNTQELIELLYSVYNPTTSQNQDLADINELDLG
jgi:type IV secretory pathway VirB4 component